MHKYDVNNTQINHIFQNHNNNVQLAMTRRRKNNATRKRKRRQPIREPANVSSLLSFPIEWRQLEVQQRQHKDILQKARHNKDNWSIKPELDGKVNIITKENRYYIPDALSNAVIQWYHEMLRHPGSTRLHKTLNLKYYIKGLRAKVNSLVKRCSTCQQYKKPTKKYGKLPAKKTEVTP